MATEMLFVTTEGLQIPLRPISLQQLELVRIKATEEADKLYGKPKKPTYEQEVFGGEKEVHEHNESTLEKPEDYAAWDAYEAHLKKFNDHVNNRVRDFILLTGTTIDMPEDASWMEMQRYFGIDIPEDHPLKTKSHWLATEAIRTVQDIQGISDQILAVSGVDERLKQASVNSFPDPVESA